MTFDVSDNGMVRQSRWRRNLSWGALAVVLLGAAGFGVWWWKLKKPDRVEVVSDKKRTKKADMVKVLQANNRGIGRMEQFEYEKAARIFEEVVALAPDWLPGKINLGIALMNSGGSEQTQLKSRRKARQFFGEVLEQDRNNSYAHFCLGILIRYE